MPTFRHIGRSLSSDKQLKWLRMDNFQKKTFKIYPIEKYIYTSVFFFEGSWSQYIYLVLSLNVKMEKFAG